MLYTFRHYTDTFYLVLYVYMAEITPFLASFVHQMARLPSQRKKHISQSDEISYGWWSRE